MQESNETIAILDLPFDVRMKMFEPEYQALVAKYGVIHLPVNIYDDTTIPGGVMAKLNKQAEPVETPETVTEVGPSA